MKYNSNLLLSVLVLLGCSAPVLAMDGARVGVADGLGIRLVPSDTLARAELPRGLVRTGEVRELPRGLLPRGTVTVRGEARRGVVARGRESIAVLGVPVPGAESRSLPSGPIETGPLVEDLLREVNATRRCHGSGSLVIDRAMMRVAERYARELARRGEVEHTSPTPGLRTFRERMASGGVQARIGGENLARLTASEELLGARTVRAWLRSPGHRVNLLDPVFARTGIGVWLGDDGIWYVVQVYATES